MSSKKSKILLAGPLQVTSYNVIAQIPAGDKTAFSQENAALRFMEHEFGDHLSLANLLKKSQEKALFLDAGLNHVLDLIFPYGAGRIRIWRNYSIVCLQ